MIPFTPDTSRGRTVGGHDIHHATADQPKSLAVRSAKAMRHAARQDARRTIARVVRDEVEGSASDRV